MADGDRLHQQLELRYQQPYRQLCEGFMQPEEQAYSLAERVKRDLKRCHPHLGVSFAAVVGRLEILSDAFSSHTQQIDAREEAQKLRALVRSCPQKRERELLVSAAQSIVNDIANGESPERMGEALGRTFTKRIYNAEFGDRVLTPSGGQHDLPEVKEGVLKEMEGHLWPQLDSLGSQFSKLLKEEKPRFHLRPRRKAAKIDDLDADITSVFKH
jgi:hypothetical protein